MIKEVKILYQADTDKEDIQFWKSKKAEERIEAVQILREQNILLFNKQKEYAESRKRLRRVYRIIK